MMEENSSDPNKLWKTLKTAISSNTKSTQTGSLEVDGELVCEPKNISTSFGTFFKSVIAKLRQTLPKPQCIEDRLQPPKRTESTFKLSNIEDDFVRKELSKIKSKTSTGFKDIPARLLKDGAQALTAPLTLLMNRTISEGSIPAEWKHDIRL